MHANADANRIFYRCLCQFWVWWVFFFISRIYLSLVFFGGSDQTHCITVIIFTGDYALFRSLFIFSECHFIEKFLAVYVRADSVCSFDIFYAASANSRVIAFKIPIKPIKSFLHWLLILQRVHHFDENKAIFARVFRICYVQPEKCVERPATSSFFRSFSRLVIYLMTYADYGEVHARVNQYDHDHLWHLICCSKEFSVRKRQRHLTEQCRFSLD